MNKGECDASDKTCIFDDPTFAKCDAPVQLVAECIDELIESTRVTRSQFTCSEAYDFHHGQGFYVGETPPPCEDLCKRCDLTLAYLQFSIDSCNVSVSAFSKQ